MTLPGRLFMPLLTLPALLFSGLAQAQSSDTLKHTHHTLNNGEALLLELPCPLHRCKVSLEPLDNNPSHKKQSSSNKEKEHPLTPRLFPHPGKPEYALAIFAVPLGEPLQKNQKNRPLNLIVESKDQPDPSFTTVALKRMDPKYPVESLSVNPDLVSPPADALDRIGRERKEIATALKCDNHEQPLASAFIEPVPLKKVTSPFGIRRLYNKQLKSRHTGVDLRAATGTPVVAPHSGKVKMAQFNWYTGGHIIVEHGWGVSSSYFHLSDLQVKVGDPVKQGQQIALSGATGRVTGPHLHWGIHVNGVPVNPLQFMRSTQSLFSKEA